MGTIILSVKSLSESVADGIGLRIDISSVNYL